jgi:hypothetical protein
MAQMLAGQGRTAEEISAALGGLDAETAEAAADLKLEPGSMEALIADGWYQSIFGTGAAHRERVFRRIELAERAVAKAQAAFEAKPTEANERRFERALKRAQEASKGYQELPEENDTRRVGDAITALQFPEDE